MAACPGLPFLAVGLESGGLELWDLECMACLHRLPGDGQEITAITWAQDSLDGQWRTFLASLRGTLTEARWPESRLEAPTDSGAGAIWSLAAQPGSVSPGFAHTLAAGCDDGSVRLFNVEAGEPGAHYHRTLARLQGRILAVAWHPSGQALVAGGADGCIHAFDALTGVETLRITVATTTVRPTCVWRLLVLPDGQLVSGDSDGAVQFWDGRFGTLLHRFTQLRADVLALASSPSGDMVFASGVDAQVAQYRRTAGTQDGALLAQGSQPKGSVLPASGAPPMEAGSGAAPSWVYTHYKRPHTHDVRAMTVVCAGAGGEQRALLVSGGLDAQLITYPVAAFLKQHPARLSKCPQPPICFVAPCQGPPPLQPQPAGAAGPHPLGPTSRPLLLCAQRDTLDVWQLGAVHAASGGGAAAAGMGRHTQLSAGSGQQLQGHEGQLLDLAVAPRHLARIQCGAGAVARAVLSPDGSFVACVAGPRAALRLYKLDRPAAHAAAAEGVGLAACAQEGRAGQQAARPVRVVKVRLPPGLAPVTACSLTQAHAVVAHPDGSMTALALPVTVAQAQPQGQGAAGSSCARPGMAHVVARLSAGAQGGPQPGSTATRASSASLKAQAMAGAWRAFLPPVSLLTASPDGSIIAGAGCQGVFLVRLTPSGSPAGTHLAATPAAAGPAAHSSSAAATPPDTRDGPAACRLVHVGKMLSAGQHAPVTSLAFNASGAHVAATVASGHLVVFEVASLRPTPWTLQHQSALSSCLRRLPGALLGCSWAQQHLQPSSGPVPAAAAPASGKGATRPGSKPGSKQVDATAGAGQAAAAGSQHTACAEGLVGLAPTQLLVFSAGGFCAVDVALPLDGGAAGADSRQHKRRRGCSSGTEGLPTTLAGAGPLVELHAAGKAGMGPDAVLQSGLPGFDRVAAQGCNGRVVLSADSCAFMAYVAPGEAVLLEKPWEDMAMHLTPPLLRQKYGR